ncbi:PEP-CTERM sorting domain-containing protein [Thalassomonas sp. RHCl1]|uniref:PEP-CTERM sorting domain-containing protein n=1 Tax=Thalassomonas sp. RHCl1 TaxID=2995320 RepID=UPI00248CB879|nr:PEP-CTERM sorting domain-containing protein [Thalassomonas sp. RHCl1]
MYKIKLYTLIAALFLTSSFSTHATLITSDLVQLDANTWQGSYKITNNTLPFDIEEFSIYFDFSLFENLAATGAPPDWDPLVIQPDIGLPDDGFYDALALAVGVIPGNMLSGFMIEFDYLGLDLPPAMPFEILDPFTFDLLDSGEVIFTSITELPVPAPATLGLLALGLLGVRRRK